MKKRAAVAVVINDEGKVLSVARKNGGIGLGLPGGKVDKGEGPVEAAVRELREETGIQTYVDSCQHLYAGTDEHEYAVDAYLVYAWHGEPRSMEGPEVRWVDWVEMFGPPWEKYNRGVHEALQEDKHKVLAQIVNLVDLAQGCVPVDIGMEIGLAAAPHGGLLKLLKQLVAAKRIGAIEYQVPSPRALGLPRVPQLFLLPYGSEVLLPNGFGAL